MGWMTRMVTWQPWEARVAARRVKGVRWPMPELGRRAMCGGGGGWSPEKAMIFEKWLCK